MTFLHVEWPSLPQWNRVFSGTTLPWHHPAMMVPAMTVSDLRRALDFYTGVLDFTLARAWSNDSLACSKPLVAMIKTPDYLISAMDITNKG